MQVLIQLKQSQSIMFRMASAIGCLRTELAETLVPCGFQGDAVQR